MTALRLRLEQQPQEWLESQNEDVRKYVLAVLDEHTKLPGIYKVKNKIWNRDPILGQAYAAKM